jgi:hypothetical protein
VEGGGVPLAEENRGGKIALFSLNGKTNEDGLEK